MVERHAVALLANNRSHHASHLLANFSHTAARHTLDTWDKLFFKLVVKYHDGFELKRPVAELFEKDVKHLFYPVFTHIHTQYTYIHISYLNMLISILIMSWFELITNL